MFRKSVNINLLFWVVAIFTFSCSQYEKILKSDDYNLKFTKAFEYYDKGDYLRAGTMFDQIAPIFRGTKRADSVYFFQAMSYFKQSDYIMSGHYFQLFSETFGNSPFVQDAAFNEAYCYYLSSPRPELDQASTYQALETFQLFMVHYPKSSHIAECQRYMTELREKLMQKSYMGAKTYFDLEDYKASVTALNSSLIDFPETQYREEILFMIVKSNYLLSVNSIESKKPERFQETIDDYYSFIAEFPESKFLKEASRMYENSSQYLKTRNIEELKQ
jgi:outer membrane protein assembly factor BamD